MHLETKRCVCEIQLRNFAVFKRTNRNSSIRQLKPHHAARVFGNRSLVLGSFLVALRESQSRHVGLVDAVLAHVHQGKCAIPNFTERYDLTEDGTGYAHGWCRCVDERKAGPRHSRIRKIGLKKLCINLLFELCCICSADSELGCNPFIAGFQPFLYCTISAHVDAQKPKSAYCTNFGTRICCAQPVADMGGNRHE